MMDNVKDYRRAAECRQLAASGAQGPRHPYEELGGMWAGLAEARLADESLRVQVPAALAEQPRQSATIFVLYPPEHEDGCYFSP